MNDALPLPTWTVDAADLLARDDPGPTPYLVDGLIVDQALVAAVGRWKTTKSYGMLEVAISVRTGRPAFGAHEIPKPGPVIFLIEESGESALWRRLDSLSRGRAISRQELRGLVFSANARVRLDEQGWQERLRSLADTVKPRLIVFDPLARMKGAGRDENAQREFAPLIEFLRELRDEAGAAVCFVHHTGHGGEQMRGTSDLESVWETRLTWKRDADGTVTIASEHRDAEPGPLVTYRIAYDHETRTIRLRSTVPELAERIVEQLREHGPGTTDEVRAGVGARKSDVQRTLETLEQAGTTHRGPSGRRDQLGRPIRDKVWNLTNQAPLWPVPETGTTGTTHPPGLCGSVGGPPSLEGTHGNSHPDEPPESYEPDVNEAEVERLAEVARQLQEQSL